ncbi:MULTISPECIES: hypothetical protein [unclassified Mesorhizobium]|uniref:hypothetical protein n=1 Tax=unclassified Mesorhizobium TaxID=325217 RepID=UPI0010939579|nr:MULTISPECIES: hypothetical protein [unclassified Mesorhizobium]TGS46250.1 hypothetical protein EN825_11605 [Mesorhizobium sp. M8A.F.Ca.ET.182.01.1.1]TGS81708.1 hypothetical protein EN824_11835 [Mesorhizobium sp. M8A.F.Ca.ET.181.01.1.1]
MPVEHPDHTNEDEERGHINQYHERLVDMSEDGEIYLQLKLTEDGKAPDESKGTFVVIPASTRVRHTVVGTQIHAFKKLAELNSAGG